MKFIDEFRNREDIRHLTALLHKTSTKPIALMEVCGGHTMAIHRAGIPSLLPPTIRLLSGPGCPVCVTGREYIDRAIAYSRIENTIVCTYGDLIRVPGSSSSLMKEKARGADIRMVYSTMEALDIARKNKDKKIIFLGIGFETTIPASAVALMHAKKEKLQNFYLVSSHKIMPPALSALIDEGVQINGYIAPGHVSTITGSSIYKEIPEKYGLAVVISGFEPVDLMQSIVMLTRQLEEDRPCVEIQYRRAVKPEGNSKAQQVMQEVFTLRDDYWRGLGMLKNSGLAINENYRMHDAEYMIPVMPEPTVEPKGCICGAILKGTATPLQCKLFAAQCTPAEPVGACMVSSEGACAAMYLYGNR